MKKTFELTQKVTINDYVIEYANFNILIKKNGNLIKCLDVKGDFDKFAYTKFINRFKQSYNKQ